MPTNTSSAQISSKVTRQANPKPRKPGTPSYRLHKATGQAVVTLSGRDVYLGPHGSLESRQQYDQAVAEWLSRGRCPAEPVPSPLSVNEVLLSYLKWAAGHYQDRGGEPNQRELYHVRRALKPLRELFGRSEAAHFGPRKLKVVRDRFVQEGLSRRLVNRYVARIRNCFKRAIEDELVEVAVWQALTAVSNLTRGHTTAHETRPIQPVADHLVDAVRPHVSRQVWGLIEVQRHTGCRPGEVVIMRGCDLDMSGPVWIYTPSQHKTEFHGHRRVIALGPRAQRIIRPFLKTDPRAFLFSPAEADNERRTALTRARKTPLSCGNTVGGNRKRKPSKTPGQHYTVCSYRRAIHVACDKADTEAQESQGVPADGERIIPRWSPNRLRHAFATKVRKEFGLDAAQVALGHAQANVTQIYAEKDQQLAAQVALKLG